MFSLATHRPDVSLKVENENTSPLWRPEVPYDGLPPLQPSVDLETKPVLKQCITARAALAELKQAAELIPNQGTLINTLPLLEARASSEIENEHYLRAAVLPYPKSHRARHRCTAGGFALSQGIG